MMQEQAEYQRDIMCFKEQNWDTREAESEEKTNKTQHPKCKVSETQSSLSQTCSVQLSLCPASDLVTLIGGRIITSLASHSFSLVIRTATILNIGHTRDLLGFLIHTSISTGIRLNTWLLLDWRWNVLNST